MSNGIFPKDDPASTARYKLFYRWLYSSDAAELMPSTPGALADLQAILNDALWAAYNAGYSQATQDCEAARLAPPGSWSGCEQNS